MQKSHSMVNNLFFLIRESFAFDRGLFAALFIRVPVNILIPLLTAYLTKYMAGVIPGETQSGTFLFYVLFYSGLIFLLTIVNNYAVVKVKYEDRKSVV